MKFFMLICVVVCMVSSIAARSKRQARTCTGLGNVPGICIALKDCVLLREKVRLNSKNAGLIIAIRDSSKECDVARSMVCCPVGEKDTDSTATISIPTFEDGCGPVGPNVEFPRIIGGKPPKIGTWTWIALLAYEEPNGTAFRCAGSIITKRHILTAAHCIHGSLKSVRLGEHDLRTDEETKHIDINIKKAVKHPSFKRVSMLHDLGILYLEEDILFSAFIKPVCLPFKEDLQSMNYVRWMPLVAGWGATQSGSKTISPIILQVQIEVYENDVCSKVYRSRHIIEDSIDSSLLCAGDIEGIKDVCSGDSGGPLVVVHTNKQSQHFILIGIVSGGIDCALKDVPSLFVRTAHYMDWIKEKVAELV